MYYEGAAIADIAWLAGLDADLSCVTWHPRNAAYRVPLPEPGAESLANLMADAVFGAYVEKHGDREDFDPEKTWQQCLVDARRMVAEPEYARLFGVEGATSLDDIMHRHGRLRRHFRGA